MLIKIIRIAVAGLLAAAVAAGCANVLGGDGDDGTATEEPGNDGNGTTTEEPGIQGTLTTGNVESAGLSAQSDDSEWEDWIVVMLSWDEGFRVPNLFVDAFVDDTEVSFDFWDHEEAFPVAEDGSFSIDGALPDRFVLFAVDTAHDTDPVQGLVGIGGGEHHWLTVHGDLLNEERILLGEISPRMTTRTSFG